MVVAMAVMWVGALVTGQALPTLRKVFSDRRGLQLASGGSIFGPFFGVWLSLVAVQATLVGVARELTNVNEGKRRGLGRRRGR